MVYKYEPPKPPDFNATDVTVLTIFLIVLLLLPFVIGYATRRRSLLALTFVGRTLGFITLAFSIDLADTGLEQLSGEAGWAVRSGIGVYALSLVGSLGVVFLGWAFMPVYLASGSLTSVDYARRRFGGRRIQVVIALLMVFINLATKVSLELHAGNELLRRLHDAPTGVYHVGLLFVSVVLASLGGLYSLVFTNVWQFLLVLPALPIVFYYSYSSVNSWEDIIVKYQRSWPTTTIQHVAHSTGDRYTKCGIPDPLSRDIVRSHNDPVLPWPGMIFGTFIIAVYSFCLDQSVLQFCFCGKSLVHVKYACILAGFFKVLSVFVIIPGFVARILFTDTVACADPEVCLEVCGKKSGCDDQALPLIFQKVVPQGWRGVVLSAFLGASFASTAATLHAGSTILTFSVYRILRPRARDAELKMVGKLAVLVQGAAGLGLLTVVGEFPLVLNLVTTVYASLAPPLVAVYLVAVFWSHVTEPKAFHVLVMGSGLSFARLFLRVYYGPDPCGQEASYAAPDIIRNLHDLHFAIFLFVICCSYMIITGTTSKRVDKVRLKHLIFWLRHDRKNFRRQVANYKSDMWANAAVDDERASAYDLEGSPIDGPVENDERVSAGFQEDLGKAVEHEEEARVDLTSREITDEVLDGIMKKASIRELHRQSNTLNVMLVLLLLVVTYVMAFFS